MTEKNNEKKLKTKTEQSQKQSGNNGVSAKEREKSLW